MKERLRCGAFPGRLMTMQDDERRRIARELHDGLGQEMVALKMMMSGISRQDPALAEEPDQRSQQPD